MLLLVSVVLFLCPLAHCMPPEWNLPSVPDAWVSSASSHRCVKIPQSVELCSNIGYYLMRLPNMLNHDTVKEVQEQTAHWQPLIKTACHKEVRVFLCSIYAPVCIEHLPEKQIRPCRSLCNAVMNSCLNLMLKFGFSWPDMLNCTQFPTDDDLMCIRSSTNPECQACAEQPTFESIISHHCLHSVVFKARIKDVKEVFANQHVISFRKKLKFFKPASLSKLEQRNLKEATLDISNCKCNTLKDRDRRDKFLFMGDIGPGGVISIKYFVKWEKKNKMFMHAVRKIRRSQKKGATNLCKVEQASLGIGGGTRGNPKPPADRPRKNNKDRKRKKDRKNGKGKKNKNNKNKDKKKQNRENRRRERNRRNRNKEKGGRAETGDKTDQRYSYNNFYYSHYKTT